MISHSDSSRCLPVGVDSPVQVDVVDVVFSGGPLCDVEWSDDAPGVLSEDSVAAEPSAILREDSYLRSNLRAT